MWQAFAFKRLFYKYSQPNKIMNKLTITGTMGFLLGLVIIIIFSFVPIFTNNEATLLIAMKIGFVLMGLGAITILISLIKERIQDDKELKKIKKEDLEP